MRFWAAHALLPGGPATDVAFEIAPDSAGVGRFTAVTPGTAPGDATAAARRRAARLRQRALPRLPPGAARPHPRRRRHVLDLAGARCTPSPPGSTPTPTCALARAAYAEMALAGRHRRRRVPLPAPRARRRPYADPQRHGPTRCAPGRRATPASGSPCSTPATSTGGVDGRPLEGVQRRFADGDVARLGGAGRRAARRTGAADRRGRALGAGGARERARRSSPRPPTGRPLHVHLSEQPAENAACLAAHGLTPTGLLAAEGVLGPRDDRRPRHPPDRRRHRAARRQRHRPSACARPPSATSPTASAPPGRCATRGAPLALGSDQHAVVDLFEEARGAGDARAAGDGGARPVPPGGAARRADRRTARSGWPDAGRLATRRARRPGRRPARHRPHRRQPTRPRCCSPRARADVDTVLVDGRRRRQRRPARARRRRRAAAGAAIDATSWEDLMTSSVVRHRDRRAHHPRPASSAPSHDAAVVVEDGRDRLGRPGRARARRRPADRRRGRAPSCPGFVDSHTHLVFAGDRAAEFAARMARRALRRRRDRLDRRRHPRRRRRDAARPARRPGRRDARPGHDDRRDQERLRAHRRRRGARAAPGRRGDVRDDVPRRARRARRRRPRDDYVALVTGPMLAACAPHARWIDVFCEPAQPARLRRRRGPRGARGRPRRRAGAAGARQPARPRPRRARWPSSWARRASTTAPT